MPDRSLGFPISTRDAHPSSEADSQSLDDRELSRVPRELASGRYSIQSVLGRGGMATVFKAWDHHLAVFRAVKVLSPELADRPAIRSRFLIEARAMARVRHRHVVAIQDVLDTDDRIFIVMELIPGGTAWESVQREGPWTERRAVDLVAKIAAAVQSAHEAGIVHRDIKPQNILLTEDGEGRLTDFGIARLNAQANQGMETRTGTVMGTWAFMPPEQRNDASSVEPRSDVYALGATLWALVRGEMPTDLFMADREPAMTEGWSPALTRILIQATRYRPSSRYESAGALAAALQAIAADVRTMPFPKPSDPSPFKESDSGTLAALLDPVAGSVDLRAPMPGVDSDSLSADASYKAHSLDGSHRRLLDGRGRSSQEKALGLAVSVLVVVGIVTLLNSRNAAVSTSVASQVSDLDVQPVVPTSPEIPQAPDAPPAEPVAPGPPEATSVTPSPQPLPAAADPGPRPVAAQSTDAEDRPTGSNRPPDEAPQPEPSPSPPPAETGSIGFSGVYQDLWLEDADGAQFPPGELPVGQYTIYAVWAEGETKEVAGEVTITPGKRARYTCKPTFMACKGDP